MANIIISCSEWGYVTHLPNYVGAKLPDKTPDGKHLLALGIGGDIIQPGKPDSSFLELYRGGFGYCRPWDTELEGQELALIEEWKSKRATPELDYYAAQRNGSPCPEAVLLYYPERVFVYGTTDEGNEMSRSVILQHLHAVGIQSHAHAWVPCQLFHGLSGGIPRFSAALRADTDRGVSWYSILQTMQSNQAESAAWSREGGLYAWNYYGGRYGELYYDEDLKAKPCTRSSRPKTKK